MNTSLLIILLSGSVLLSYGFELISHRTKLPAVVLLLFTGMATKQVTDYLDITISHINLALPVLGTLGLILIVLEGGLDLELSEEKKGIFVKTLVAAFLGVVISMLLIAFIFYLLMGESFYNSMVTATPFAIISSAIALPSIRSLDERRREFMVYESSLSDILGLMLFNILVIPTGSGLETVFEFVKGTLLIIVISILCCFLLLYLISRISHHIKYLPIISTLIIVYAVGKSYNLSSLLAILVFGLFLNNTELFIPKAWKGFFKNDLFEKELEQFKNLTVEGAFVVRTFFFLLFGYSTNIAALADVDVWIVSVFIVFAIVASRYLALKSTFQGSLNPILYIAPRGLISVLLFLSIPPQYMLKGFREGILMLTVLLTVLLMMIAIVGYQKQGEADSKVS